MGEQVVELLTEIRDLLRRLVESKEYPLPARATTALRRGLGMKYLRTSRLLPHSRAIANWLQEGRSQREVIKLLAERGIRTTSGGLSRFIRTRLVLDPEE